MTESALTPRISSICAFVTGSLYATIASVSSAAGERFVLAAAASRLRRRRAPPASSRSGSRPRPRAARCRARRTSSSMRCSASVTSASSAPVSLASALIESASEATNSTASMRLLQRAGIDQFFLHRVSPARRIPSADMRDLVRAAPAAARCRRTPPLCATKMRPRRTSSRTAKNVTMMVNRSPLATRAKKLARPSRRIVSTTSVHLLDERDPFADDRAHFGLRRYAAPLRVRAPAWRRRSCSAG